MQRRLLFVSFALLTAVLLVALVYSPVTRAQAKKWPPQFPREGATKLFENEQIDRKSTRLNSSHIPLSRMPSSA